MKKRLQVYLSKDLEDYIKAKAELKEISVSSVIESILLEYKVREELKPKMLTRE